MAAMRGRARMKKAPVGPAPRFLPTGLSAGYLQFASELIAAVTPESE